MDTFEQFKKFEQFLNSKEGQKSFDDYVDKLVEGKKERIKQLASFHLKRGKKKLFVKFTESVIEKYDSDKYKNFWRKQSIEPPDCWLWFLLDYAEKYGRKCKKKEWKKYGNMFTSELFFVNGYYFQRIDGQGCAVLVDKKQKRKQ